MPEKRQFQLQAERARRLAGRVTDREIRKHLLETADEYLRLDALFEARSADRRARQEPLHADA